MLSTDISEWCISFIDTGIDTAIGERLRRVRPYLDGDEIFLANYGDVLTDAPMNDLIEEFRKTDAVGQLLAVKPQDSFHVVDIVAGSTVTGLTPVADMAMRINGGYFVLRQGIFDYLEEGEDLVMDACIRAAKDGRMRAAVYDGFWAPMDTVKERSALEAQYRQGNSPWAVWRTHPVELGRPVIPVQQIDPFITDIGGPQ
jgi:glucose-1-phosphate cytidylyltransferase